MRGDTIKEVGIDEEEQLYVCPATTSFDHIFRAAMEVHWDPERRRLFSPKPREWSYLRWFQQITAAAMDEYGVSLTVTSDTVWSDVPEELRAAIVKRAR